LPNWRASDVYTETERLVLDYGECMTITGKSVDDELFDRLATQFSEAQIVELTAGIAMENFRSKFNAPLKVEAQGFCPLPAT
jgi:alkylhydroperoxidase family enzyme